MKKITIASKSFSFSLCLLAFFTFCKSPQKQEKMVEQIPDTYYSMEDFSTIKKFDTHVHLRSQFDT
ncbi:hypothetical protein, partial [uncultured Cyclobacterium sp.]|uniref:hypothetical protein n=1 Tax=uncultured Cyclobacterium sp. TaxID=453820 RepID=UPI0030EE5DA1